MKTQQNKVKDAANIMSLYFFFSLNFAPITSISEENDQTCIIDSLSDSD